MKKMWNNFLVSFIPFSLPPLFFIIHSRIDVLVKFLLTEWGMSQHVSRGRRSVNFLLHFSFCHLPNNSGIFFFCNVNFHFHFPPFSGIVIGAGAAMVRESAAVMVGYYFKRRRQFVEMIVMAGEGVGIALFSVILKEGVGWASTLRQSTLLQISTIILLFTAKLAGDWVFNLLPSSCCWASSWASSIVLHRSIIRNVGPFFIWKIHEKRFVSCRLPGPV